jgi:hypothetical protein
MFPDKRLIKTYDALWGRCRSIAPLQLLSLEIFNLIATLGSYVFLNLRKWNKIGTRRRHHRALARARPRPAARPRGARGGVRRTDAWSPSLWTRGRRGPSASQCTAPTRRPALSRATRPDARVLGGRAHAFGQLAACRFKSLVRRLVLIAVAARARRKASRRLPSPCLADRLRLSLGKVEPAKLAPSLVRISPTPFLHVLTTPLEPAKPLAHLHSWPTRRSRGSGGPRSTLPPFSIAGAPPDARNDKNRTPGEPTPLPRPFPAKFGLLLAGFRPSSSLSAVWTTLRGLRSF